MKICSGDFSFEDLFMRFFLLKIYLGDSSFYEDVFKRFFLWRFIHEIFPFEDLFRRFFLLWGCVHGDFSFENLFRRFFILKICSGDFSSWRFVQGIFPFTRMCSWRFIQEIFPFMKICSCRFFLWRLKCRRFIHFWRLDHWDLSFEDLFKRFFLLWRCVQRYLSIEDWIVGDLPLFEDLSFGNLNKRFIPWKFVHGD